MPLWLKPMSSAPSRVNSSVFEVEVCFFACSKFITLLLGFGVRESLPMLVFLGFSACLNKCSDSAPANWARFIACD